MNTTLLNILNGIATAARNASPPDQSTMAIMDEVYTKVANIGPAYDASTASASPFYLVATPPGPYPAANVAPSYDTIENLGIANIRLVGG